MSISIHYVKPKNTHIFQAIPELQQVQTYFPLYDRFFAMNESNCNSIQFNYPSVISKILHRNPFGTEDKHSYTCQINQRQTIDIFMKMAPLLDPFKYIVGKYDVSDPLLFQLPSFHSDPIAVFAGQMNKLSDPNNSAYIDSFFSYLSCRAATDYHWVHGLQYYGSFLAIKKGFQLNVADDLEYLLQSAFFTKNVGVHGSPDCLFTLPAEAMLEIAEFVRKPRLNLSPCSGSMELSVDEFELLEPITESLSEPLFEVNAEPLFKVEAEAETDAEIRFFCDALKEQENMNIDRDSRCPSSSSSCSSRVSLTPPLTEPVTEDSTIEPNAEAECESEESGSESEYSSFEEPQLLLTFDRYPVQVICMEQCKDTLDSYILENDEISQEEWCSILMQIIMTLIAYGKWFDFTHNDLHTNNILYTETDKHYLYYCFQNQHYRVPTFGKIYKIIDFGRAIYTFNGQRFCSDSFSEGGDAATQYNTEPYFNPAFPRIDPNPSFDLCRLGCSIYEYIVDDCTEGKEKETNTEPINAFKVIQDWCTDDDNKNMLYKANGEERYPDFKLYKMIARRVHRHTPLAQLARPEFKQFECTKKSIHKNKPVMNVDKH